METITIKHSPNASADTITFEHLTLNTAHNVHNVNFKPCKAVIRALADFTKPGAHSLERVFRGSKLSMRVDHIAGRGTAFSLFRGQWPVLTCNACFPEDNSEEVWGHVLAAMRNIPDECLTPENIEFTRQYCNFPPLRRPTGAFLATRLWPALAYDPNISLYGDLERCVYWSLWRSRARLHPRIG
jgi:hypothetical protein